MRLNTPSNLTLIIQTPKPVPHPSKRVFGLMFAPPTILLSHVWLLDKKKSKFRFFFITYVEWNHQPISIWQWPSNRGGERSKTGGKSIQTFTVPCKKNHTLLGCQLRSFSNYFLELQSKLVDAKFEFLIFKMNFEVLMRF